MYFRANCIDFECKSAFKTSFLRKRTQNITRLCLPPPPPQGHCLQHMILRPETVYSFLHTHPRLPPSCADLIYITPVRISKYLPSLFFLPLLFLMFLIMPRYCADGNTTYTGLRDSEDPKGWSAAQKQKRNGEQYCTTTSVFVLFQFRQFFLCDAHSCFINRCTETSFCNSVMTSRRYYWLSGCSTIPGNLLAWSLQMSSLWLVQTTERNTKFIIKQAVKVKILRISFCWQQCY
jgi:hypothetical protein